MLYLFISYVMVRVFVILVQAYEEVNSAIGSRGQIRSSVQMLVDLGKEIKIKK